MKFVMMPYPELAIEGTDMLLRQFAVGDIESLVDLATEPAVSRYVPWAKWVTDRQSAEKQIIEFNHSYSEGTRARYVIENSGKFVGYIGVWPDANVGFYQFGFAILPEHRGQGFGTLAVQTLIQHVEKHLKASGMVAYVDEDNEASKATILKLGFASTEEFDKTERRYELILKR